jgi:antitoxin (DNA-binding transcriptional repressor) of toxin-antitoxin stability system
MDGLTQRAEDVDALTPELLERVKRGELEITRGGAVVAKVMASSPLPELPKVDRRGLAARLQAVREEAVRAGLGLSHAQIRELRNDHSSDR